MKEVLKTIGKGLGGLVLVIASIPVIAFIIAYVMAGSAEQARAHIECEVIGSWMRPDGYCHHFPGWTDPPRPKAHYVPPPPPRPVERTRPTLVADGVEVE